MKNSLLGLLLFSSLGFIGLPASADQVTVQNGSQTSIQQGNGNLSIQQLRQNAINANSGFDNNQGIVQNGSQGTLQTGNSNAAALEQIQQTLQLGH